MAKALPKLPYCADLFDRGKLVWSVLREISRIATLPSPLGPPEGTVAILDTENAWIKFAREHTFNQLRFAVQEALKKGRRLPPKDGYGLSNLIFPMTFDFTLEERNLVQKALEKIAGEMRESFGEGCEGCGGSITSKEAILYIAQLIQLLHLGFLVIEEKEDGTYRWLRSSEAIDLELAEEEKEVAAIPLVMVSPETAGSSIEEAGPARKPIEERITKLIRAFQEAGIPGSHAAERVRNGYERLRVAGKVDPTDEELRQAALEVPDSLRGPEDLRQRSAM